MYKEIFGKQEQHVVSGNGRVEVIGNFTDQLEGGHAIGAPIENSIKISIGDSPDGLNHVYSETYAEDGIVHFDPNNLLKSTSYNWLNYIQSVFNQLRNHKGGLKTFNMHISSNLPSVGGLSSSAALEVGVIKALLEHNQIINIDQKVLAKLCRNGEIDEEFVGSSCGYLDQACSIAEGTVYLEFTGDESNPYNYEVIDLSFLKKNGYKIILGLDHSRNRVLTQSGYPQRAAFVNAVNQYLHDNGNHDYQDLVDIFGEEAANAYTHVVQEDARVQEAKIAAENENVERFLELINQSGDSSIKNYGVSEGVQELKQLVELARSCGAAASRNHGGGWNTNFLFITKEDKAEQVKADITSRYSSLNDKADLEFIDINLKS